MLRDGLMDFVARETELAKAELIPAAKQAGIGSAFVGAAVTFLLHSLWMLVIVMALALSWLLSLTGLNTVGCLTLGFLTAALLSIGIAALLILIARRHFKQVRKPVLLIFRARARCRKVKAPTATIEEAKATFVALTDAALNRSTEVVVREEPSLPEVS